MSLEVLLGYNYFATEPKVQSEQPISELKSAITTKIEKIFALTMGNAQFNYLNDRVFARYTLNAEGSPSFAVEIDNHSDPFIVKLNLPSIDGKESTRKIDVNIGDTDVTDSAKGLTYIDKKLELVVNLAETYRRRLDLDEIARKDRIKVQVEIEKKKLMNRLVGMLPLFA